VIRLALLQKQSRKAYKATEGKNPSGKVRITLDLSPEFYNRLERLESRVGAESKAQVVREALRLYEYIASRYIEGDEFLTRAKDGTEKTIVLLGSAPAPA
jgi:predicted DNA-binding protein